MAKCSLQNIISRIFKESKIYRKNLTLHSLRHTYAERLRRKGVDLPTINKILGHSRLDNTDIYLHLNKDDFKMTVLYWKKTHCSLKNAKPRKLFEQLSGSPHTRNYLLLSVYW